MTPPVNARRLSELADSCLRHLGEELFALQAAESRLDQVQTALRQGRLDLLHQVSASPLPDSAGLDFRRAQLQAVIAAELQVPLDAAKVECLARAVSEPQRGELLRLRGDVRRIAGDLRTRARHNLQFIGQSLALWERTMRAAASDISMSFAYSAEGDHPGTALRPKFVAEI